MDLIAWDMRYGSPNQKYLELVARILQQETKDLLDPFTQDAGIDAYVKRENVENDVFLDVFEVGGNRG